MVIIEMNPRVSRSSALASKATGFPIAKIADKLAVGYRLDELKNDITQVTPTSFEAAIDYVVTKLLGKNGERFEYLTGNTALSDETFSEKFEQSQGLPFNPVNFHRYRLGQLRHADAFLYVRTALSESGAFEVCYNVFAEPRALMFSQCGWRDRHRFPQRQVTVVINSFDPNISV
jgi:hypothetical protein